MKLSDVKPNPKNPRTITPEKLKMLKKALHEFGDLGGIVFNTVTKQLVGGHQRLKALPLDSKITVEKKYQEPTRTGTTAEGYVTVDGERFKYREVKWSIRKERLANIAANKGAGEWDLPQLGDWFKDLSKSGLELDFSMFDEKERAKFLKIEAVDGEDDVPEIAKVAKSKIGNVYQLGGHRLMCGDSTNAKHVEQLMNGVKADLVFTDPPYGVNYDGGHATEKRRTKLANDHDTLIYDGAVPNMEAFSKSTAALYLWFAATKTMQVLSVLQKQGYEVRSWIIWNKNMAQFGAIGAQYKQKHEPCLYAYKKGHSPYWRGPANEVSVWDESRSSKNEFHPTQKPVSLSERAIKNSCPKGGAVLDLFGGSGSTMIGAEKSGAKSYTMELDPLYVDVIIARWEKFTGLKAKLIAANAVKKQGAKHVKADDASF